MTLINLHVYESEIKPCPIYISDCTTGPVSPSAGGGDKRGRNIVTSEGVLHCENCFSDRYALYILSAVNMVLLYLLFIC